MYNNHFEHSTLIKDKTKLESVLHELLREKQILVYRYLVIVAIVFIAETILCCYKDYRENFAGRKPL